MGTVFVLVFRGVVLAAKFVAVILGATALAAVTIYVFGKVVGVI